MPRGGLSRNRKAIRLSHDMHCAICSTLYPIGSQVVVLWHGQRQGWIIDNCWRCEAAKTLAAFIYSMREKERLFIENVYKLLDRWEHDANFPRRTMTVNDQKVQRLYQVRREDE